MKANKNKYFKAAKEETNALVVYFSSKGFQHLVQNCFQIFVLFHRIRAQSAKKTGLSRSPCGPPERGSRGLMKSPVGCGNCLFMPVYAALPA